MNVLIKVPPNSDQNPFGIRVAIEREWKRDSKLCHRFEQNFTLNMNLAGNISKFGLPNTVLFSFRSTDDDESVHNTFSDQV